MANSGNGYLSFIFGFCTGIVVFCAIGSYFLLHVDRWLVVDNKPSQTDLIVVLGGGGASRLRKGISLYDQGFSNHLLLVDEKVGAWTHITKNLCKDCNLEGKNVVILTNSTSTFTDAALVKKYCLSHGIKSFLVVTDPYHSRRVFLTFGNEFKNSSVLFTVVNSGEYNSLLSPGIGWWSDRRTLETVWLETAKCLYVIGTSFYKVTTKAPTAEVGLLLGIT